MSRADLLFLYSVLSVVRPRAIAHAPSACASAAHVRLALVSDVGLICDLRVCGVLFVVCMLSVSC